MLVAQAKAAEEHFFGTAIDDGENERILAQLRQETENIVLIGMPGCGKTTVGQAPAQKTGREAIDLDKRIAARAGCSMPEMFCPGRRSGIPGAGAGGDCQGRRLSGKILLTGGGVVKDTGKLSQSPPKQPHLPPAPSH